VEAETAWMVATHLGLGQLREQLPDQIENAGIRGRVGAGRIADRVLIDVDDLINVFETQDVVVRRSARPGPVQLAGERVVQDLVNQRALARAADASDGEEGPQGEAYVDVFEIILARALHREPGARRGQRQLR